MVKTILDYCGKPQYRIFSYGLNRSANFNGSDAVENRSRRKCNGKGNCESGAHDQQGSEGDPESHKREWEGSADSEPDPTAESVPEGQPDAPEPIQGWRL